MDNLDLINIDLFKQSYYKAFLPLKEINEFLSLFNPREHDKATKTLISLFDTSLTKTILANLDSITNKHDFLRLAQDDYSEPKIMEYLEGKLPDVKELITQSLERTLLSAKKVIL